MARDPVDPGLVRYDLRGVFLSSFGVWSRDNDGSRAASVASGDEHRMPAHSDLLLGVSPAVCHRATGSTATEDQCSSDADGPGLFGDTDHDCAVFRGGAPAKAAIIMGGLLLLTRRTKSRRLVCIRSIDSRILGNRRQINELGDSLLSGLDSRCDSARRWRYNAREDCSRARSIRARRESEHPCARWMFGCGWRSCS